MKKINLEDYQLKKEFLEKNKPVYRNLCTTCLHPEFSCYCQSIKTFDPQAQFVILIHPIEFQRRIATGRMAHLTLENSVLIRGHDYTYDPKVNELIQSPQNNCFILYPGVKSINLSLQDEHEKSAIFSAKKRTTIFVIDGTWATARQMLNQSQNLKKLPRVSFSATKLSNFRVRKQPEKFCLSTIEAIHQLIDVSGDAWGFRTPTREHDQLLNIFDLMVDRQICFSKAVQKSKSA